MENKRKRIQAEEEEKQRKRIDKCKRRELAVDFPEETIQYIQSFLNAKQGARTTLVSKSWYSAWLSRPHLYFDQQDFASDDDFWIFVNNTFQRYEKLNLTIHTLKLWILHAPQEHSLVNNLIITALKMGATDLDFKIYRPSSEFFFPNQVFAFHDLSRLSVSGCQIGLEADKREEVVCCSRLKSLALESVYLTRDEVLWDIISCCPSIENFLFLSTVNLVSGLCSKAFLFGLHHVFGDTWGLPNAFHKLKRLSLYEVRFHPAYFNDFSSKFPCLEDLALHNCWTWGHREVTKISSPSLQRLTYTFDKSSEFIRSEFDVPRIHKFTFSGIDVPFLSFEPRTSTWESDISIQCNFISEGWFRRLNELLKGLSLSKVSLSLSLKFLSEEKIYVFNRDFLRHVSNKPEVENLTVKGPEDLHADVFNFLLQCCHPIYVSQYAFPKKCTGAELKKKRKKRKKCTDEYDFSKMIQQVDLDRCIAYQRMTPEGESDLEEVSVEFYDESVSEWRLLDTSTALEAAADEHKIRLHLRWGR